LSDAEHVILGVPALSDSTRLDSTTAFQCDDETQGRHWLYMKFSVYMLIIVEMSERAVTSHSIRYIYCRTRRQSRWLVKKCNRSRGGYLPLLAGRCLYTNAGLSNI